MNKLKVSAHVGHYIVASKAGKARVGKDKRCSCGGTAVTQCVHIKAVALYLRQGGRRAQDKPAPAPVRPPVSPLRPPANGSCPMCGAAIHRPAGNGNGWWRCEADPGHYFAWRGEQGVRQFLTRPHPGKMGAFYRATDPER